MNSAFEALEHTARKHPGKPFLHIPASSLPGASEAFEVSYAETLDHVKAVAAQYRAKGWGRGHRVALLMENRPEMFLHFLALNAVGASVVPINPDYRPAEMEYVLAHSEATLAVALAAHLDRLRALPLPGLRVVEGGDSVDPPAAPSPARAGPVTLADECALLYTSGTTGKPKGCILSNGYFIGAARHYLSEGGYCTVREGEERLITPLPLFHMNALAVSTTAMILSAGCVVQLDRFHPRSWLDEVIASGATIVHYLGVMPAILLTLPPGPKDRQHRVRFGFGANANPKDHAAFEARFGFPLIEAWAMTETGPGAMLTASTDPRHVGERCVGKPRDGLELRIVDAEDRDVPEGEPGQLLVRQKGADPRRGFFSGYLKDEAATEAAWKGGWFHTGDSVRRGPDGMIHFVDRQKNIIRRSGENIAALEVEAALADHPAVRQIAVIAAPDAVRDEEVMACIVPAEGVARSRETALSIQAQALDRLTYFKAPGWVAFVDGLPTTATNKVQKAKLSDFGADPLNAPDCFDLRDLKKRVRH